MKIIEPRTFYVYEQISETLWQLKSTVKAVTASAACEYTLGSLTEQLKQNNNERQKIMLGITNLNLGLKKDEKVHTTCISPLLLFLYSGW